jgi:small subunit ribosomal protein S1
MAIKEGDTIKALVVEAKDNGLYLRHEDKDGFINVTNITWKQGRVDPRDHAKAGDHIDALVYAVTPAQFYASIKDLHPEDNPWRDPGAYAPGSLHGGIVRDVKPFGAFIELDGGAVGCVLRPPNEHGLSAGDRVEVEVLAVDPGMKKIDLALRGPRG